MGKDSYIVLDGEDDRKTAHRANPKKSYDPGCLEEVKIEFTVPDITTPGKRSEPRQPIEMEVLELVPLETDRRQEHERRMGTKRRMGSRTRRGWQEPRWIGAPDCRVGLPDRRRAGDRRRRNDRRLK